MCDGSDVYDYSSIAAFRYPRLANSIRRIGKKITQIVCSDNHAIIKLTDGTLLACGENAYGQLGLEDTHKRSRFVEINGIKNAEQIICGIDYTIIRLANGTLMSCGRNYGQLGHGDCLDRNRFEEIPLIPKNIAEVLNGDYHLIIRLTDGTLMSCGSNGYGQLALGDIWNSTLFQEIKIPKNIAEVKCASNRTIIRLTNGILVGCGENRFGQLGLGDILNRNRFERIGGVPHNVAEIILGSEHTIIRLMDGTLMGCGNNQFGQLGLGDNLPRTSFREIKGIPKNILKVITTLHTIIVLTNGTLLGCGSNRYGQLGLGDYSDRHLFEEIKQIPKNIPLAEVICDNGYTVIRLIDGTLMCCGWNEYNERNSYRRQSFFKEIPRTEDSIKVLRRLFGLFLKLGWWYYCLRLLLENKVIIKLITAAAAPILKRKYVSGEIASHLQVSG